MKAPDGGEGSNRILKRTRLRFVTAFAVVALVCPAAASEQSSNAPSATASLPQATKESDWQWRFALLPRSFQKHPWVDFNVISEMTVAGRLLPQPSPEQPLFYELHQSEISDLGVESEGTGRPPNVENLTRALEHALSENGLLPGAPPQNPATILLVCHWGYYSLLQDDPDFDAANQVRKRRELLDRAALIGGEGFAREFAEVLEKSDSYLEAMAAFVSASSRLPQAMPIMGDMTPGTDFLNPLELFKRRDDKTRHLVEESSRPCYFVVVSAYDRESAMKNRRVLLWRTKMTVNADGVSMRETLLPLIANTGAYLAKDMTETATVEKRINRGGKVELGPLRIIGWEPPAPDGGSESTSEADQPSQSEAQQNAP